MNRAVRTVVPVLVTSLTSTMPRPVLTSTRSPFTAASAQLDRAPRHPPADGTYVFTHTTPRPHRKLPTQRARPTDPSMPTVTSAAGGNAARAAGGAPSAPVAPCCTVANTDHRDGGRAGPGRPRASGSVVAKAA